jgi:hypothetical protein
MHDLYYDTRKQSSSTIGTVPFKTKIVAINFNNNYDLRIALTW